MEERRTGLFLLLMAAYLGYLSYYNYDATSPGWAIGGGIVVLVYLVMAALYLTVQPSLPEASHPPS